MGRWVIANTCQLQGADLLADLLNKFLDGESCPKEILLSGSQGLRGSKLLRVWRGDQELGRTGNLARR
jgi:hypothetical protein